MTICNWENNRGEPQLQFIPKIVDFLGYQPPGLKLSTLGERILQYRYLHGISQKELAKQIGIDQGTLSRVERNRGKCLASVLQKLRAFLGDRSEA